ncbi:hypothetical protein D019_3059 [Vibrio parahaemolyticus VP2007-095]|nr:hypothetical protein D019_3059 [Vibrio parahaemolyticus VP2007-095]
MSTTGFWLYAHAASEEERTTSKSGLYMGRIHYLCELMD